MELPHHCVVDASVAIKLFVEEDDSTKADALFDALASNPNARFVVPDLFYVECANILWQYARRGECSAEEASRSVGRLLSLVLDGLWDALIVEDALALAVANDITVYDACYVAAAQRCNAPLITADEKLASKVGGEVANIVLLGEIAEQRS